MVRAMRVLFFLWLPPSGEAAARRRLMRGGLATTTRYRANCGGFSLIRPRAGPRAPFPEGEGQRVKNLPLRGGHRHDDVRRELRFHPPSR